MRTQEQIDHEELYERIVMAYQFVKRREALGLDAETVAAQAGYSITQYKLMEEGKRMISVADFFRVADVWYSYEDAEYNALERRMRKTWRTVKRQFYIFELQIEQVIPDAKTLFDAIPLRVIVALILIIPPALMLIYYSNFDTGKSFFYCVGVGVRILYDNLAAMLNLLW